MRRFEKVSVGKGRWKSVAVFDVGPMKSRRGGHCAYDGRRMRLAMTSEETVALASLGETPP